MNNLLTSEKKYAFNYVSSLFSTKKKNPRLNQGGEHEEIFYFVHTDSTVNEFIYGHTGKLTAP